MLRIGIECESLEDQGWGIARLLKNLLSELAYMPGLAGKVSFILFFKSKIPAYDFLDSPLFEKVILKIPGVPPSFSLYYYAYLPIYLWFRRVDVVFFPNYMLPLIFFGKSIVLTADDAWHEMRSPHLPFRYRLAYSIFGRWAVYRANLLQAMSESSKKELVRLWSIDPRRIYVNHLGIESPSPVECPKENFLLFVGQAFPRRHLKESLLAFAQLAREYPNLALRIVGPDKYSPPVVENLIKELSGQIGPGRIEHRNSVSDQELDRLYKSARVLLYVSEREAFGLPALEALVRGTVPVVADTAVGHELLGEGGIYAVRPFGPNQIADAVRQALAVKQGTIIKFSAAVQEKFLWKYHAERFLNAAYRLCYDSVSVN